MCRKEGRSDGTARAGTDVCWLELGADSPPATRTGTDVPPATQTGTGSPSKTLSERLQGLTNPSSATEAGEDRLNHGTGRAASRCSLERVVRRDRAPTRGRADGKARAGEANGPSPTTKGPAGTTQGLAWMANGPAGTAEGGPGTTEGLAGTTERPAGAAKGPVGTLERLTWMANGPVGATEEGRKKGQTGQGEAGRQRQQRSQSDQHEFVHGRRFLVA